jgi:Xaa-Pro aminopeptidase
MRRLSLVTSISCRTGMIFSCRPEKNSSSQGYKMTLFSAGSTPDSEKWDGARTPVREAPLLFHSDEALPISSFSSYLRSTVTHNSKQAKTRDGGKVYLDTPVNVLPRRKEKSLLKHLSSSLYSEQANAKSDLTKLYEDAGLYAGIVQPLAPHIAKLRSVKSPVEQRVMRTAADISGRAHTKVYSLLSSLQLPFLHRTHRPCGLLNLGCPRRQSPRTLSTSVNGMVLRGLHMYQSWHLGEESNVLLNPRSNIPQLKWSDNTLYFE